MVNLKKIFKYSSYALTALVAAFIGYAGAQEMNGHTQHASLGELIDVQNACADAPHTSTGYPGDDSDGDGSGSDCGL